MRAVGASALLGWLGNLQAVLLASAAVGGVATVVWHWGVGLPVAVLSAGLLLSLEGGLRRAGAASDDTEDPTCALHAPLDTGAAPHSEKGLSS